jgi:2-acylglycerol O-acyltransferase 2
MPSTVDLNPEPSVPEERAEKHLPPKSYADAAEEALHQRPIANHNKSDNSAYEGKGRDGAPASSITKVHEKTSLTKINGKNGAKKSSSANGPPPGILIEKYQDHKEPLTSVEVPQDWNEQLRLDKKEKPSKHRREVSDSLVSGRKAGAGWDKSRQAIRKLTHITLN